MLNKLYIIVVCSVVFVTFLTILHYVLFKRKAKPWPKP